MERYDLKNKKIAVISVTSNHDHTKRICDSLHEMGASLVAVTPDGQEPDGWDAGKSLRLEQADPTGFDSLLVITDDAGTKAALASKGTESFISSFFERKRPVSAMGNGSELLGELGLLEGRKVSADSGSGDTNSRFGASFQSEPMTTDAGLTTAVSSMSLDEFVLKVAEEVKEGRHEGQHA